MKEDEIRIKVEEGKDKWLIWAGFICDETEEQRDIEYFGKFAPTKQSVIGAAKLLLDNTDVYRLIIQNTKPFKIDPASMQHELTDFFKLEVESN